MGKEMLSKEILEKLSDRKFLVEIFKMESREEIIRAFEKENIKISEDQIDRLEEAIKEAFSKVQGMSKEDLEKISAGGIVDAFSGSKDIITDLTSSDVVGYALAPALTAGIGISSVVDTLAGGLSPEASANIAAGSAATIAAGGIYLTCKALGKIPKWISGSKKSKK